jgi:hypothetical protein
MLSLKTTKIYMHVNTHTHTHTHTRDSWTNRFIFFIYFVLPGVKSEGECP